MVDTGGAEWYTSRNAYLLSYVRRDDTSADAHHSQYPEPPIQIMDAIASINETEQAALAVQKERMDALTKEFQTARTQRMKFFDKWRLETTTDPSVILPTAWLTEWICGPFSPSVASTKDSASEKSNVSLVEMDDVVTAEKPSEKRIIDTSPVLCSHGKLDLLKLGRVKRIHREAVAYLCDELAYEIKPSPLTVEEAICEECIHAFFDGMTRHHDDLSSLIISKRKTLLGPACASSPRHPGAHSCI